MREAAINSDVIDGINPLDPADYPGSWLEFAERRLTRYSGWSDWKKVETNTNWEKLAFDDDAKSSAIDVSASGGSDKTKFYISLAHMSQDGILVGNGLKDIQAESTWNKLFPINLSWALTSVYLKPI